MTQKLRLLKVLVQPVFVLDDGETLSEQQGQGIEVAAPNWPAFGATAFNADEMQALQAQLDDGTTESKAR